jgi:signal transduction histidine kinase
LRSAFGRRTDHPLCEEGDGVQVSDLATIVLENGVPPPAEGSRPMAPDTPGLAQRLHDTGRFAGRVAHDFDNILMGVMGFAELTQPLLDPGSPAARYVGELLSVALRGLEATRQMHQFSRSGQASRRPTRLDDVWHADAPHRQAGLPSGVQLEADIPVELPPVAVAADPLCLVLRALVQNAAEAMTSGGPVAVSARPVNLSAPPSATLPEALRPGSYVEVTVADHGGGFRQDVLTKLTQDVFVTTKVRHRGLGLATVLRTLHVHGGGLVIESTPHGTAVRAYLPAAAIDPPASGMSTASASPTGGIHP